MNPIPWRRLRRKRILLPFFTLLLLLSLFIWIRHPTHFIRLVGHLFPFKMSIEEAKWESTTSMRIREIHLGDFAQIERAEISWHWWALLWSHELDLVHLNGPHISTEKLAQAFPEKNESNPNQPKKRSSYQFGIKRLELSKGYLFIEDIIPRLKLNIPLGRSEDMVLENLVLGDSESDAAKEVQHLNSSQVTLYSPFDATSPVLGFSELQLDFTLEELTHQTIRKIRTSKPRIYIGPDLFWFLEQFQANQKSDHPTPWVIRRLEIDSAGITINGFGNPGLEIPLFFSKDIENIRTDQFGDIFRKNQLDVQKGDLFFPSYGLNIYGFDGRVEFGLPVTEENVVNQVISLKAERIEWKKLLITEPWLSVTFDSRGIFGKIGGKAYGGYLSGDCSVFFQPGYPWVANVRGNGLRVEEPISKLVDDHFRMTGIMNIDIHTKAKSTIFDKSTAKIWLTGGGKMVIPAIDDLIPKLPHDWAPLKKQLTTIGLESFKTFDYSSGTFDLTYEPIKSTAILDLQGKQGRRRFQVDWTQEK